MVATPTLYARSVFTAWQEAPAAQRPAVLENFLRLLRANGEADLVGRILEELSRLEADARAEQTLTVVAARPLPSAALASVVQVVRPLLPTAPDRTATFVDPSLVGGVVIRTPTVEIDASVHRVLARLQE